MGWQSTFRRAGRISRALGLVLVLVLVLGAGLLWWFLRPPRTEVVALFQVTPESPDLLQSGKTAEQAKWEWDRLKRTQQALFKSNWLLTSALRVPGIGALSILADKEDPSAWLQDSLQVSFPKDGEVLQIKLVGTEDEKDDLVNLVNAVVKAYQDEALSSERQQRANTHDRIQRTLNELQREILQKSAEYYRILEESENVASEKGRLLQQLDTADRARIEQELLRLQAQATDPAVVGKDEHASAITEQIARLNQRSSELRKQLIARSTSVPDLIARGDELARLNRYADELTLAVERSDLDRSASDRIRLLQMAVASDEKQSHVDD